MVGCALPFVQPSNWHVGWGMVWPQAHQGTVYAPVAFRAAEWESPTDVAVGSARPKIMEKQPPFINLLAANSDYLEEVTNISLTPVELILPNPGFTDARILCSSCLKCHHNLSQAVSFSTRN